MADSWIGTVLCILVASAGFVAHAEEPNCEALRAEVATSKQALRDCLAGGGSCKPEFAAVETAMKNLGPCPEEAPPTPTPTPIAPPPGPCDKADAALRAAKATLRDCAAKGGTCTPELKAVEAAMADANACAQAMSPSGGATSAPESAGGRVASLTLADGSVLRGTVSIPDDAISVQTALGTLRVPTATIRTLELGSPQGSRLPPQPQASEVTATDAPAPPFGEGRFELGGGFSFDQFSTHDTVNSASGSSDGDAIALSPFVGWFQANQLEWTLTFNIRHSFTNYSDNSNQGDDLFGVFLGSTYLFPVTDQFYVGPVGMAGYSTSTFRSSDSQNVSTSVTEVGPGILLGVNAKVPIGGRGILTLTVSGYGDAFDLSLSQGSAHATGTMTDSGLQSTIGFSAVF